MGRNRRGTGLALLTVALLTSASCRTPGGGGRPAGLLATQPCAALADLQARPLYTFNEAEVDRYLRHLSRTEPDFRQRVVHLARKNIGQPYEIYLLGEFPFEFHDPDPIYCLTKSDCVTFCEHMYSMALSGDWWTFLPTLQRLRYRDGAVGMLTRNHYTESDWDGHNAFLFEDLTTSLGAGQAATPMNELIDRAKFFAKYGIGQNIPVERFQGAYIPKANVPRILPELQDADFVNIIRGDADSQFAGHTGIIGHAPDGTIDFIHSAGTAVREQPLVDYIEKDRKCVGIKILRPRSDAMTIMAQARAPTPDATPITEETLAAALAASPLMSTGAPTDYSRNWARAMRMQAYRLDTDTPPTPELQARLEEIDARVGSELGIPPEDRAIGVLDLTDQRVAMVRPDDMFYGASVPKICILAGYFDTHPEAATALDPQVDSELQLMIKRSNNEMAAKYSQIVGLDAIQKMLQSKQYHLYDREHGGFWCGKHYGIEQPRMGDPVHDHSHAANVRQALRYYLMLEQGRLISAPACAAMKRIFAAPQLDFHNDRFVRGLNGRDVTILRKSGLWEDWHLDTARVQHGDRIYLLAGMAKHPKGEEYLAATAAAIDDLLCGPHQTDRPFFHQLVRHETADDFAGGTLTRAALAAAAPGAMLTVGGDGGESAYQSPVINLDWMFNEALLSWNIDNPTNGGYCVELRVGRQSYDTWSPWLTIVEWGEPQPNGQRVLECDQGRIDVDYFRSKDLYDRVQYRIRAVADGPEQQLHLRRAAVCLSDTTGIPTSLPLPRPAPEPRNARQWQRRLPVPFRSQNWEKPELAGEVCSPTSVAMVMEYRGVKRSTEEVCRPIYDAPHKIYGNWPLAVQGAYTFGVPGYLTRFRDWDEVKRMIAADQPLVISILDPDAVLTGAPYKGTIGHLLVITGFDAKGRVLVNDPAGDNARKGQLAYQPAELEKVWMRAKGGAAYVLLPPE